MASSFSLFRKRDVPQMKCPVWFSIPHRQLMARTDTTVLRHSRRYRLLWLRHRSTKTRKTLEPKLFKIAHKPANHGTLICQPQSGPIPRLVLDRNSVEKSTSFRDETSSGSFPKPSVQDIGALSPIDVIEITAR
jgi:hypothetical protein